MENEQALITWIGFATAFFTATAAGAAALAAVAAWKANKIAAESAKEQNLNAKRLLLAQKEDRYEDLAARLPRGQSGMYEILAYPMNPKSRLDWEIMTKAYLDTWELRCEIKETDTEPLVSELAVLDLILVDRELEHLFHSNQPEIAAAIEKAKSIVRDRPHSPGL
ncbi:MAG TPA: hypothetical protein ENH55_06980 [Aurantimonas coralicida]|uniref:Uncharacterized protein n=2 Tax=root TaxID=1 RepID=A0A9C9NDE4_9HYPH|nr:hypothetical protein [Aurantimonas coralicida]HET99736.1 hypothetical protein [Aurantimonas coralicida]